MGDRRGAKDISEVEIKEEERSEVEIKEEERSEVEIKDQSESTDDARNDECKEDILILLDVNGLLGSKGSRTFRPHPGAKSFIEFCFDTAKVGIFSSMMKHNVFKVLDELLTDTQKQNIFCVLDRDACDPDPQGSKPWDTIKNVSKVKAMYPTIRKIILCDDSKDKLRFNPPETSIVSVDFEEIKREILSRCSS